MKMEKLNCKMCGAVFTPHTANGKYCCSACRLEAAKQRDRARYRKNRKKPKITIEQVGRFQVQYKEQTGIWLKYTEACKMLEERSEQNG